VDGFISRQMMKPALIENDAAWLIEEPGCIVLL
jgi:hypothetical protein